MDELLRHIERVEIGPHQQQVSGDVVDGDRIVRLECDANEYLSIVGGRFRVLVPGGFEVWKPRHRMDEPKSTLVVECQHSFGVSTDRRRGEVI